MTDVFTKPKKPKVDPEQLKLVKEQKARLAEQDSEIAQRKASKRSAGGGRSSLVAGSERGRTGQPTRTTTG